jgi:hypothetical protein
MVIELGYRTPIRWLHELDFHLRVPQPWPEWQNEQEQKEFWEQRRGLVAVRKDFTVPGQNSNSHLRFWRSCQ